LVVSKFYISLHHQTIKYMSQQTKRSLHEIATEIRKDWKATSKNGIYFGAVPYLDAMECLTDKNSMYGYDSASSIVNYFLANASTYRGTKAKELKAELKAIIK
jgi:hypothetical protein